LLIVRGLGTINSAIAREQKIVGPDFDAMPTTGTLAPKRFLQWVIELPKRNNQADASALNGEYRLRVHYYEPAGIYPKIQRDRRHDGNDEPELTYRKRKEISLRFLSR